MQPIIGELPRGIFVVYLNNSNKILSKSQLSKGGITGTLVDTISIQNGLEMKQLD
jgi:DNA repair protein RadC